MRDLRDQHGCAKITRNRKDYIAVFGGYISSSFIPTATIELYDLSLRPAAWEIITGLSLGMPISGIMGWFVKTFDVNICSAMFMSIDLHSVYVCNGNYNWSNYYASDYISSWAELAIVDASLLGGDAIW